MLTRIEIDGFKNFKDFKVELAPFQVIVGPNGSGKSNLFDALHLLSRLAEVDLRTAFQASYDDVQRMRGDAHELFTILPNGQRTDQMRLAVEMLIDRKVHDDLGREAELQYTRLRYELEISFSVYEHSLGRPHVTYESLKSISPEDDSWCKKYGLSTQNGWLPNSLALKAFIDTRLPRKNPPSSNGVILDPTKIYLYPDGKGEARDFRADKVQRTVLSSVTDTTFLHAFAVREELRSFRIFHLNPTSLRKSSPITALPYLTRDGDNLPTTLARLQTEDEFALTDVSRDIANLVPGILRIRVETNQASNEYNVWAETSDQRSFSAQVLSDGTLRLLALATLRNDPQFHGVLCLEEPENGVQPLYLENMARLLREMATDFSDPQQIDEPLRQVLITTHSPAFISLPEVIDTLLFAHIVTRGGSDPNHLPIRVTRMVPVVTPGTRSILEMDTERDRALEVYTIDMVRKYLSSDNLDEAGDQLEKARLLSVEGKAQ